MYAALGTGQIVLTVFASYYLAMENNFTAILIHKGLLVSILQLPLSFFGTTPSGRIPNQFPKIKEDFNLTLFIVIDQLCHTYVYDCHHSTNNAVFVNQGEHVLCCIVYYVFPVEIQFQCSHFTVDKKTRSRVH